MVTKNKEKKASHVKLDGFKIFIDAEWTKENIPVSVQVLIQDQDGFKRSFIVINEIYQYLLDENLLTRWMEKNSGEIVFYNISDQCNVVHELLRQFYIFNYSCSQAKHPPYE